MRITLLEISNFKRIKALRLVPNEKGLTTIGGRNSQGKTSVLDAIQFGFGGKKYMPSEAKRDGAVGDTLIRIETDNGLIIERKGKNLDLVVTDKDGKRSGQALLDALISELAIDLPKFHNASSTDKADMLLKSLGIGDKLDEFDRKIKAVYDKRTATGQMRDSKRKHAKEMPFYEDAPEEPVSVADLVKEQQDVLARNGIKNEHKRNYENNKAEFARIGNRISELKGEIERLEKQAADINAKILDAQGEDFTLEPTDEIEKKIASFEETNRKVRANADRARVEADADMLSDEYDAQTTELEKLRNERLELLNNAKFPLPELSVDKDAKGRPCLTYRGKPWDCMSGSQQLIVDTAIASMINPECKFVNLDKLEQLDLDTLKEFDAWLVERDLQCIATRVSTGDECSVVICDGEAEGGEGFTIELAKRKPEAKPLSDDDY